MKKEPSFFKEAFIVWCKQSQVLHKERYGKSVLTFRGVTVNDMTRKQMITVMNWMKEEIDRLMNKRNVDLSLFERG